MRLTLGPLQYFWPRQQTIDFYASLADAPLDVIYLGETVCSKRRELRTVEWIELATHLAESGREVVLSTLALIEAESELGMVRRLVENGNVGVEANDLSAVQLLRERGLPFVVGPSVSVYNQRTLALLQADGMRRLVLGVEQGRQLVRELREQCLQDDVSLPELELIAWGRLPLSWSARCFTARAHNLAKDQCGFRCIEDPDGMPLATRDGDPFLTINGIQVQSGKHCDLAPQVHELEESGIDLLRIYPGSEGTLEAILRLRNALDTGVSPGAEKGSCGGYWNGAAGMEAVPDVAQD